MTGISNFTCSVFTNWYLSSVLGWITRYENVIIEKK